MSNTVENIVVVKDQDGGSASVKLSYAAGGAAVGLLQTSGAYWNPDKSPQSIWCDVVCQSGWTATSKVSWLTVTSLEKGVKIFATENTSGAARSGTIELAIDGVSTPAVILQVTQAATVAPGAFHVSPAVINATAAGGDTTVALVCPGYWSIRSDNDWVIPHTAEGNFSTGTGNRDIVISVAPNPNYQARTVKVRINFGWAPLIIEVRQAAKALPTDFLKLGTTTQVLPATAYGPVDVQVKASATPTISSPPEWLTATVSGGAIKLTTTANTSAMRTTELTVTSGAVSDTLTVEQLPGSSITVTPATLPNLGYASPAPKPFTVKTARPIAVSSSAGWLWVNVIGYTQGSDGFYTYNLTYAAPTNMAFATRTGAITIFDGVQTETVDVTQDAAVQPDIEFNPATVTFTANATVAQSVTVTSARAWDITSFPEWLTVDRERNSLSITPTVNTGAARSGAVVLTSVDTTFSLTVAQAGV